MGSAPPESDDSLPRLQHTLIDHESLLTPSKLNRNHHTSRLISILHNRNNEKPLRDTKQSKMCSTDIFLGLLAILFPPLAVWVKRGICSADSVINICLCCLGFIPGLLHAWCTSPLPISNANLTQPRYHSQISRNGLR